MNTPKTKATAEADRKTSRGETLSSDSASLTVQETKEQSFFGRTKQTIGSKLGLNAAGGSAGKPDLPRSNGQKAYNRMLFAINWIGVSLVSLGLAYAWRHTDIVRDGKHYNSARLNEWLAKKVGTVTRGLDEQGNPSDRVNFNVGVASSVFALQWGGNLFLPILKWMDDRQERFVNWWNKKRGSGLTEEQETQIKEYEATTGESRFGAKRGWPEWIKGRAVVLGSAYTASVILSKVLNWSNAKGVEYTMKGLKQEEPFNAYIDGLKQEISNRPDYQPAVPKTPLKDGQTLEQYQDNALTNAAINESRLKKLGEIEDPAQRKALKTFRIADLIVLDAWITAATTILLLATSAAFARSRDRKKKEKTAEKLNQQIDQAGDFNNTFGYKVGDFIEGAPAQEVEENAAQPPKSQATEKSLKYTKKHEPSTSYIEQTQRPQSPQTVGIS